MDLELEGKSALVTGGSVGIGAEIARGLAAEGCRVAILARRTALLEKTADAMVAAGLPRSLVVAGDVTADGAAERARAAVEEAFGHLDILVNNAGGSRPMTSLGSEAEWEEGMLLNFTAARRFAHAFVPGMRERRFGRIINITGGDEPVGLNAANPPNGAIHIWAKGLARTVGADGVTVNSIPPGRIHSEQIDQRLLPTEEAQQTWARDNCPVGYIGDPRDLSVLVSFLASPLARYITGQVIYVDGGARHFSH